MCSCLIQNFFRRVAGFEVRVLRESGLCAFNIFFAVASALRGPSIRLAFFTSTRLSAAQRRQSRYLLISILPASGVCPLTDHTTLQWRLKILKTKRVLEYESSFNRLRIDIIMEVGGFDRI